MLAHCFDDASTLGFFFFFQSLFVFVHVYVCLCGFVCAGTLMCKRCAHVYMSGVARRLLFLKCSLLCFYSLGQGLIGLGLTT